MKVRAVVHKAEEGGFWAEVPSLPGCATQGETIEELNENLRDAIDGYVSVSQDERLSALRTAIDEGDSSGIAEGDVFVRVHETLKLPQKPR